MREIQRQGLVQGLDAEKVTLAISKLYFYKLCFKFTINDLYYITQCFLIIDMFTKIKNLDINNNE